MMFVKLYLWKRDLDGEGELVIKKWENIFKNLEVEMFVSLRKQILLGKRVGKTHQIVDKWVGILDMMHIYKC